MGRISGVGVAARTPSTPLNKGFWAEFGGSVADSKQGDKLAPVTSGFAMERQTALLAEEAGEAVNAMVRWGLAAQATRDRLQRLEALAAARRQAELAFHQAVWAATSARPKPHTWRQIAPLTGMPWQTLYRRYRHRPDRLPTVRESIDEQTSTRLMGDS